MLNSHNMLETLLAVIDIVLDMHDICHHLSYISQNWRKLCFKNEYF